MIWEKEAKYWYYKHGPLARTEIGDLDVQGMDYAYTLQGWVKGINSNILEAAKDLGRDAMGTNTIHSKFAADAAAYSLNYFRGDYIPISNNFTNFTASIDNIDENLAKNAPGLYNGNISHMVTTIKNVSGTARPQLTAYRYDQLNRIKQMRAYQSIDIATNKWDATIDKETYAENYTYCANGNIKTLLRYDGSSQKVDELIYNYAKDANQHFANNRLLSVRDAVSSTAHNYDIDSQDEDNYGYDAIGNMTKDKAEEIAEIKWTVYGKIKEIIRRSGSTKPDLEFCYDAMGNRVCKIVKPAGSISSDWQYTFYVRDAQGNILSTYTQDYQHNGNRDLYLSEVELYGSSRIGLKLIDKKVSELSSPSPNLMSRSLGLKRYEISNHLGNVLTTFTDQKKEITNGNVVGSYAANIKSSQDYYPFGMIMNGRNYNTSEYRFGFNGQEKDQEIYNNQSTTTATFWEYDGRIGRRWNIDPVMKIWESSYACFSNNPVINIDPNGDTDYYNKAGERVGSDGVDNGVNLLVLKKSVERQIERQLKKSLVATLNIKQLKYTCVVPKDEILRKMDDVYNKTESSGTLEHGFVATPDASSSVYPGVPGTANSVPSFRPSTGARELAVSGVSLSDAYSVHSHPDVIKYNSKNESYTVAGTGASEADISASVSKYAEYILQIASKNSMDASSADLTSAKNNPDKWIKRSDLTERKIIMYNSVRTISTMNYNDFKTLVNKINRASDSKPKKAAPGTLNKGV